MNITDYIEETVIEYLTIQMKSLEGAKIVLNRLRTIPSYSEALLMSSEVLPQYCSIYTHDYTSCIIGWLKVTPHTEASLAKVSRHLPYRDTIINVLGSIS